MTNNKNISNRFDNQLVNDPRIDSPDIKVIFPNDTYENIEGSTKSQVDENQGAKVRESMNNPTDLYGGTLNEIEVVAPKKTTQNVPDEHVCSLSLGKSIKQHWLALLGILITFGLIGVLVGRTTKKIRL